jgi:hypothetical protein
MKGKNFPSLATFANMRRLQLMLRLMLRLMVSLMPRLSERKKVELSNEQRSNSDSPKVAKCLGIQLVTERKKGKEKFFQSLATFANMRRL